MKNVFYRFKERDIAKTCAQLRATSALNFDELNLCFLLFSLGLNRTGWTREASLRCNSSRGLPRGSVFRNNEKQAASRT